MAAHVAWSEPYAAPAEIDLLINATSLGAGATSLGAGNNRKRLPVVLDALAPEAVVADVIVNPPTTRLLADAAARGHRTLDGLSLLAHQTAESFRIWTGAEPDMDLIREGMEEFLGI